MQKRKPNLKYPTLTKSASENTKTANETQYQVLTPRKRNAQPLGKYVKAITNVTFFQAMLIKKIMASAQASSSREESDHGNVFLGALGNSNHENKSRDWILI
ncbi:hypothetical protein PoB_001973300 [Plakobranchus ocellatus]|uniref:Uncharacterized protein n=1 Tax=Plakobranchus ocellatus TaxID=259542 RepID=A0AAV3ZEQ3_9GAST|nr:hypothetical protein PoB_001973300 [Plakobranchus ocellatus]